METNKATHVDTLESVTGSVGVKTIPIQGLVIPISPVRFKNIPQLIVVATPIMEEVAKLKLNDLATTPTSNAAKAKEVGDFLIKIQKEDTTALALMSEMDEEWVENCDANEITDLFLKCITVNIDFFTQRWLPTLSTHLSTIKSLTALVGSSKSKG